MSEQSLAISREEYDALAKHDYAGPGTPLRPDAPGVWYLVSTNGWVVLIMGARIGDI